MLTNKTRDYHTEYSGLKEKQTENLMNLPAGFYFRTPFGNDWKFNFGISAAYSFAFAQKFKTTKGSFQTKADYASIENGIPVNLNDVENLPKHNLTEYKDFKGDGDLKQHLFNLGAETSFGYSLTKNLDLNFGIYFNYVFSDQNNIDNELLYDHKLSVYNGTTQTKISDNIHPLMFGAMIGLSYRFNHKKEQKPAPYNCEKEINQLKNYLDELKRDNDKLRNDRDSLKNDRDSLKNKNGDLEEKNKELEDKLNKISTPSNTDNNSNSQSSSSSFEEQINANDPIYFDLNAVTGDPQLQSKLNSIALAMKENPERNILIEGHTCDLGSPIYNKQLSLRRAEVLKQELIKRGIASSRIRTIGMANEKPIVPNSNKENRKLNRCAIIKAE